MEIDKCGEKYLCSFELLTQECTRHSSTELCLIHVTSKV